MQDHLNEKSQAMHRALSVAAQQLLSCADWDAAVHVVLKEYCLAADLQGVFVVKNFEFNGKMCGELIDLYNPPGYELPTHFREILRCVDYLEFGFENWFNKLEKGEAVYGKVEDFPAGAKAFFTGVNSKAAAIVPIIIDKKLWGVLGADHRIEDREWQDYEIESLISASSIISSAMARKGIEERLKQNEEKFSKAFLAGPDAIVITKAIDGTIVDCNAFFVEQSGFVREQIVGKAVSEINSWLDLEQRNNFLKNLKESGSIERFETQLLNFQKRLLDVSISARLVEIANEQCIISIIRDISDIKFHENALKLQRDLAVDLGSIDTFDKAVKLIVSTLRTFADIDSARLYLLDSVDGVLRLYAHYGVSPVFVEQVREYKPSSEEYCVALQNRHLYLEEGSAEFPITSKATSFEGLKLITVNPVRFQGRVIGCIMLSSRSSSRITAKAKSVIEATTLQVAGFIVRLRAEAEKEQTERERRAIEEQLRQAQKMEAIGQLAGGVAHDLNNIIHAIRGYTELNLGSVDPTSQIHSDLKEAMEMCDRAATLIKQLLAFSRREPMSMHYLDLDDVVGGAMKMLYRIISENISIIVSTDAKAKPIYGDKAQLEQVIVNICINARDAMLDGGKMKIETSIVADYKPKNLKLRHHRKSAFVKLSISDDGHGISDEIKDRIFEPFFTTKEIGKGTGLGLAMAYGIVEEHQGEIDVKSTIGVGTTFNVYLPMQHGEENVDRQSGIDHKSLSGNGEVVLIAEDDPSALSIVSRFLKKGNYRVLEARDGLEAIKIVNLALLDVMMPKMSGSEVYKHIIENSPTTKILFSTGYSKNVLPAELLISKAIVYKPYDFSRLLMTIKNALEAK